MQNGPSFFFFFKENLKYLTFLLMNWLFKYHQFAYSIWERFPKFLRPLGYFIVGLFPFYAAATIYLILNTFKMVQLLQSEFLFKFFLGILCTQGVLMTVIFLLPPAKVVLDEGIEEYISLNRKELKKSKCKYCKITKTLRSFHCDFCGFCIAAWQEHSFLFNKCIDGRNIFIYWIYLICSFIVSIASLVLGIYYNILREKGQPNAGIFIIIYGIQAYLMGKEGASFTSLIARNCTIFEKMNAFRIPYFWADENRTYFNPFDCGIWRNFKQSIKGLISKPEAISSYTSVLATSTENPSQEEKKQSCESPLKEYDGTFDPNWAIFRIYNIFDILNAPLREQIIKYAAAKQAKKDKKKKKLRGELEQVIKRLITEYLLFFELIVQFTSEKQKKVELSKNNLFLSYFLNMLILFIYKTI